MSDLLRRRLGIVLAVAVVLLLLSANRIANLLTDLWWYDTVGYRSVFAGILWSRVVIWALASVAVALLVGINLHIARRLRPIVIPSTPQQAIVERYRQAVEPYLMLVIIGVALLFGFTSGFALSAEWQTFLMWRHGGSFGVTDPQFGADVGFYVFRLPFWRLLQGWAFTSLVLTGLLTAGAHYLLGGIRPEAPREKVIPPVRVHLSALLILILLVRGWGYWLDRFMLNFSERGQVTGASYTDVTAELPALNLLLVITVAAVALVAWSVRREGFLLPGAAVGLLVLASIVLQGIYPAAIQRLQVDPQELARESQYIERNLDATRRAYGLDEVPLRQFAVANDLDEDDLRDNEVTLQNVRLWDPEILKTTYAQLQALRPYYEFIDVDVDRYVIDGELRQVMLGARELQFGGLDPQAQTWQNERLTYTHGLGLVASQVNVADREGQPVFLARDIPPRGMPELVPEDLPGIYFGELTSPSYSIIRTDARELDFEEEQVEINTVYDGEGAVRLGGRLRRLAFALRFADTNFILSGLLREDSGVIYRRNVAERVRAVAPYLLLDSDPYPVVLDGRVLWIQDAYTTSNHYPYSERRILRTSSPAAVNYVRNSVKAVVDAFDGTVTLYVVEPDDPIIQAWRSAFPAGYADRDELPEGLEAHFRYPEDMFQLQARVFLTYHILGVDAFYSKADAWRIPRDPTATTTGTEQTTASRDLDPYYLLMRLPGEDEAEFVLIQPYLPVNKDNMVAWLAARSDPEHYGQMLGVQFPSTQTILGPSQAQARIDQNDRVAEYITLRDQRGSRVIRGNLLVLPVAESILYVQPLFLASDQARIPELDKVVVVMAERVAFENSLEEALVALVTGQPVSEVEEGDEADPDALIADALRAFADAREALAEGLLGEYQRQVDRAFDLLRRAAELRGVEVPEEPPEEGATPAPSPSPAAAGAP